MNFILENTFLWEEDWRPLIKFHCLITMQWYYEGQPVPPFSKHLGAVSKATPLHRAHHKFTKLRCVSKN